MTNPKTPSEEEIELIKFCLEFDSNIGAVVWRERPLEHFSNLNTYRSWNTRYRGTKAGRIQPGCNTNYRTIGLNGEFYLAHRAAWLLHHGEWPNGFIDHIDGDGLNNNKNNLRVVTRSGNSKNRKLNKNSKYGIPGVYWWEDRRKWRAEIKCDGVKHSLGMFETLLDAAASRKSAENRFGFSKRHGAL